MRKSVESAASSAFDEVIEDMKKLEEPEANILEWFFKAIDELKKSSEDATRFDEYKRAVEDEYKKFAKDVIVLKCTSFLRT